MKSRKLEQLRSCNNLLRKQSWSNFHNFLSTLLRSIDHPLARDLESLLGAKDFDAIMVVADSISSTVFRTAAEHRLLNQLSAVIRKYPFPPGILSFDPRGKAISTFMSAEHRCKRINRRFSLYQKYRSPHELSLSRARSWIDHTLGTLRLSDVYDLCDFGPGASVGVHGNATNAARKLLAKHWSVTPGAFYTAYAAYGEDPHIQELLNGHLGSPHFDTDREILFSNFRQRCRFVDNNKIAFVPKTAKTERTIAVEPLLNGYVQKGVDLLMRKRLKRVGIDLSDQTKNQELARKGSLFHLSSDPYVTIDLSSASDSISIELCRYMLPYEWFRFLDSIRSHRYELEGTMYTYHKFVSMGNGFCFPLETLIFASLCHTACSETGAPTDFSVYGDDIIIRQSAATRLMELLSICGFKANRDKTFLSGPFRESCGADWFEGEDVRPMSLDYAFDSVENIFKFCNLSKSKGTWECIFLECREFLASLIPKELLFVRPYKGNVDTALEVPLDVFLSSPFSRYSRNTFSWSWMEIRKSAYTDIRISRFAGYNIALIRGALSGISSSNPFAERRKTRTKIVRVSPGAGWSIELPGENWESHWVSILERRFNDRRSAELGAGF